MIEEDKFHYQGKFFEKEEDFWKYVLEWDNLQVDEKTASDLAMHLARDIELNSIVYKEKITNKRLKSIIQETFLFFCNRLHNE